MNVKRIREAPRITRPFSDESWARLDALGEQVDADLSRDDVRLTMGGEPTFVSIDDMESPEWNIAAVGPTKRALADELIRRLRDALRARRAAALRAGQMVSRRKPAALGVRAVLAQGRRADLEECRPDRCVSTIRARRRSPDGRRFDRRHRRSGSASMPAIVLPAYEDPVHWLQKEAEPAGQRRSDRLQAGRSGGARAHGAGVRQGLDKLGGFVLPIQRWNAGTVRRWISERWQLRRGHLFLMPGDSPLGLRLPIVVAAMDIPPEEYPYIVEHDPMEPRDELPARRRQTPDRAAAGRRRTASRSAVRPHRACRSSRATACCASSCRRSRRSKIISN